MDRVSRSYRRKSDSLESIYFSNKEPQGMLCTRKGSYDAGNCVGWDATRDNEHTYIIDCLKCRLT
jgi:hypothetical protein